MHPTQVIGIGFIAALLIVGVGYMLCGMYVFAKDLLRGELMRTNRGRGDLQSTGRTSLQVSGIISWILALLALLLLIFFLLGDLIVSWFGWPVD